MSNSFTSPPVLVDPARTTAGLTIRSEEAARIGDQQNYTFAHCGTHDCVSQFWNAEAWEYSTTTMTKVCEWYIPHPSEEHLEFKFRLAAYTSVSGGQAQITLTFPLSGNSYSSSITTISDTSRFNNVFEELTVNVTAVETETVAILELKLKAATSGIIEVASISGRWSPLSSPLSAGLLGQFGQDFVPAGASRLGNDLPLTSRFGVDSLSNIQELRKRGRTLLSWSGVEISDVINFKQAAKGLGSTDPALLYSIAHLSSGMNLNSLNVDVFINVANLSSGSIEVDIFGYRFSITSNGWSSFGVDLRTAEHELSSDFRYSVYKVGLEQSIVNQDNLLSGSTPISSNAYIKGLVIIAV